MALFAATGCLDAGGPPSGQRWISGRTVQLLQFVSVGAGAPPTSLLISDGATSEESTLYLASDPGRASSSSNAPSASAGARLLLTGFSDPGAGLCAYGDCRVAEDSLGRLLVPQNVPQSPGVYLNIQELYRFDLSTAAAVDLGQENAFATSPSGMRLFIYDESTGSAQVREVDDRTTSLDNIQGIAFVGEDLYYVQLADPSDQTTGSLGRLTVDGTPEVVVNGPLYTSYFSTLAAGSETLLVLNQFDPNGAYVTSLVDPATLVLTPLPGDIGSVSPDGNWLVLGVSSDSNGTPSYQLEAFDRSTGATQPLPMTSGGANDWRPGHVELWMSADSGYGYAPSDNHQIQIWQPGSGATLTQVAAALAAYPRSPDYSNVSQTFTRDGQHWFSFVPGPNGGQIYVGRADDPAAATFPVNPLGTGSGSYWELVDGRLLVEASVGDYNRNDIYLVDPDTGQSRALATGGHVVTIGTTRALALLDWDAGADSGELTLIDFDSGAITPLGQNVRTAIVQRQFDLGDPDADLLPPGAEVAFLVHDSLASPYDGVWVLALP
ncbi:MAG TPA: hypothetical protein VH853_13425 [Polyangia bacterium]|nr:hypothetical protein [Polyangia bacterium]